MSQFIGRISDSFVEQYRDREVPWGPVGYVTYKRTYARKIEGEKRTEEWFETIKRCVNGVLKIGCKLTEQEAEFLYDSVFNLKCSFSGRALWQLGTKTVDKIGGDSCQNCWVVACDEPVEPFCFTFNELMLGGGVGYNIQKEYVYEIPKVKYDIDATRIDEKDVDFVVPDNREGWVELLRRILQAFFHTGKSFTYSTICIRGKGAPIKSFGGTASGPEDLCKGMDSIIKVLKARIGKKLRPIDCLDVFNIIGSVVVAGNVRRSAQLALGDMEDHQYLDAKNWGIGDIPNWRAMSNNSIACNQFKFVTDKFWSGYNGDGEAYGLINLANCRKYGRMVDGKGYRDDPDVVGTNPCITGDTLVHVADGRGMVPIKQLAKEDLDVPVFCNDDKGNVVIRMMQQPRKTGTKASIFKVTLENGCALKATGNHKFLMQNMEHKELNSIKTGDKIRITTRSQGIAKSFGCNILSIEPCGTEDVYNGTVDEFHNFFISGAYYTYKRKSTKASFLINCCNCGELPCESKESCNLAEIFLPNLKNADEFEHVANIMYKVTKTISCLSFIHEETNKIVGKNHRLGVGVTGFLQAKGMHDPEVFNRVYHHIEKIDKEYSKIMGVDPSIKLTTVKPSGTLSLLAGCTPGVHPAYSPYYIRRIRMASSDVLVSICRKNGYHVEPLKNLDGSLNRDTMVVSFPVKVPEGTVCARDLTAVEQLEHAKWLQTYWSDNSVSVTVYYKQEELPLIKEWLSENYDKSVKSVSFLLHSGHGFVQAPYEEITKEQYEAMAAKTKPIPRFVDEKETGFVESVECAGGSCPIK